MNEANKAPTGLGCTVALTTINASVMGMLALSFAKGSYSSPEQEHWYRYGSLGFLLIGVFLPLLAILSRRDRSKRFVENVNVWMVCALVGCFVYAYRSGGGI